MIIRPVCAMNYFTFKKKNLSAYGRVKKNCQNQYIEKIIWAISCKKKQHKAPVNKRG